MKAFYSYIEKEKNRFMAELFELLSQKSISSTGEGINDTINILSAYMKKAGISVRTIETEGYPALYGEVIISKKLPTILVYGHYDVQPARKDDGWDKDPFKPYVKNGRIVARGSSDDKGQLFTHIKAIETWKNVYGDLPINIKMLFEGEEEIGSPNLDKLVKDNCELLKCDLVIVSDSHIHESLYPVIIMGLKGMLYVEMRSKQLKRDLHSKFAAAVESPVWRLLQMLQTLRDSKGSILLENFYDEVIMPSEIESSLIKSIPYDKKQILDNLGVDSLRETINYGDNYYYNMMFEPTCNIDGIRAGYIDDGAKTVLPSEASVKIDFRLVPNQNPEKVLEMLKKHLVKNGFDDIEITYTQMMYPCRADVNSKYVEAIRNAIYNAWNKKPLIYPSIGGSGPNYIFSEKLGVDCITVPYAGADQNNHSVNENMIIEGFYNGIKTNGEIIKEIGALGDKDGTRAG